MRFLPFALSALFLLVLTPAAFGSAGVTYHGRLLKADSTPVDAAIVQFKIQIRSTGPENCLFYEETHTRNMTTSNGVFAITINDGTASSANTEPFSLDRVFQNRGTFGFGVGKCAVGSTYAPNPADGRKLVVEFNDGTFAGWEQMPAQTINHVPSAIESMTVGGFNAASLFRVADGSGSPSPIAALSLAQHSALMDLANGTSAVYRASSSSVAGADVTGNISGTASGFTGSLAGDVTGTQGATSVVKIRGRDIDTAPPSTGQVLKWNGVSNRWEPSNDATGGAPSAATTSAQGIVELATDGENAANVVVQGNDSRLSNARAPTGSAGGDLLGSSYPNPTIAALAVDNGKIAANAVDSGKIANGAVGVVDLDFAGAMATNTGVVVRNGSQFFNLACTAGQVLKWTGAGWACGADDNNASPPTATTSVQGIVELATDGENAANVVVQGNDSRLSNARAPTAHTHPITELAATGSSANQLFGINAANNATEFKTIASGTGINVVHTANTITINATGGSESTAVTNVGTGAGVYRDMSGSTINLRSIKPVATHPVTVAVNGNDIDVGVNAELQGLGALSANGFVRRTAAGTYSPVASMSYSNLNQAVFTNNTGLLVSDGTSFLNKDCLPNQILKWLSPTGWTCAADDGAVESDPQVGTIATNQLGKWDGSALVTSAVFESAGKVGVGTTSPASTLTANGEIQVGSTSAACAPGNAGAFQYAAGTMQYCNGSAWAAVGGGAVLSNLRTYTSGATWTKPANLAFAIVEVWGGGGSGASSYTGATTAGGGAGGSSSFGAHLSATGGTGAGSQSHIGGAPGSGSGGDLNLTGAAGGIGGATNNSIGGFPGGGAPFGGAGGPGNAAGGIPGGGGGGGGGAANPGAGGGGGGYSKKYILAASLGSTVAVTVGVGGARDTSNYNNSGGGGHGMVLVHEYTWPSTSTVASSGSGTPSYLPLWTSSTSLGDSPIAANGSSVGIGTTTPVSPLHVFSTGGWAMTVGDANTGNQTRLSLNAIGAYNNGAVTTLQINPSGGNVAIAPATGNVGIGTSTPAARLDVVGAIKLGTMAACTATEEGSQRYNSTSKKMEFCNGLTWAEIGSSSGGAGFANMQVFTSNGTFTVPAGVTKVKATVVGGGGGGNGYAGAGGGGGGTGIKIVSGLTPGATVAVTVGGGGAGHTTSPGNGGTSSFGAHVSATGGGIGGNIQWHGTYHGAPGGIGSSGDLNIRGGAGGPPRSDDNGTSAQYLGGNGGSSTHGGGAATNTLNTAGSAGGSYGGGGSGGAGSTAGGNGAAGVVIVEY